MWLWWWLDPRTPRTQKHPAARSSSASSEPQLVQLYVLHPVTLGQGLERDALDLSCCSSSSNKHKGAAHHQHTGMSAGQQLSAKSQMTNTAQDNICAEKRTCARSCRSCTFPAGHHDCADGPVSCSCKCQGVYVLVHGSCWCVCVLTHLAECLVGFLQERLLHSTGAQLKRHQHARITAAIAQVCGHTHRAETGTVSGQTP